MKNMFTKLAALACLALLSAAPAPAQLRITEFMASNTRTLADEDGSYEDWIEIYNPATNTVDLSNWSLTDNAGKLNKWQFPATNIGPNRFLVVFASNKNRRTPGARLHTNFKLDPGGEFLALVQPDGTIASSYSPTYPAQLEDVSYGLPMESLYRPLVETNSPVRVLVPLDGSLGTNWLQTGFNDSGWRAGTNSVGYDTGLIDKTKDTHLGAVLDGSPLCYWRLNESSGTNAANSGLLNPNGTASFIGSPTLGQAGPRPTNYNGFETTNVAPLFSGVSQYLNARQSLLNNRLSFAVAGWFNAASLSGTNIGLWGQKGLAAVGFRNSGLLEFWTANGGAVSASVSLATGTWHHLAAVADSGTLSLYLDGALLEQGGAAVTNYGSNAVSFTAADGTLLDPAGTYFNGLIDELTMYDRALTAGEVSRLYQSAAAPEAPSVTSINLARLAGASASQSSLYPGGDAYKAIDGNTDGIFANGSVTHTSATTSNNEWWEVDLVSTQRIDRVHVWFRTDCCTERNENLRVVIYDHPTTRTVLWTQNIGATPGSNRYLDVKPSVAGRVVRVEHISGTGALILSLAEVQVFQWVTATPIVTDVRSAMCNTNATAYLRFPFTFTNNISDLSQLLLRVRYDDGFVAFLNGVRVAARNAPLEPQWNSAATAAQTQRFPTEEVLDISVWKSALQTGTNVLAIQGLNVAKENSDFLLQARLHYSLNGAVDTTPRYFSSPSPGAFNGAGAADIGPVIRDPGYTPTVVLDNTSIVVTSRVSQAFSPVASVVLHYRVMFDAEQTATMLDDGLHSDGAAGDGVYGATIPETTFTNGQMVRWYITASDISNRVSRWPLFPNSTDSEEYLGTVVADTNLTSKLPIFHLFVAPGQLAGIDTESGGRGSFFYDGEFYDNIYLEIRGNSSVYFTKKSHRIEFNKDHPLRHPGPGGRIRKTSLLAEYPDPAYIRQHLCMWFLDMIGVPTPFEYPVRLQLNGAFYQLAFHNDVMGDELLSLLGYDPEGALYKAAGVIRTDHFSTGVFTKVLPNNVSSTADFDQLAAGISENNPQVQRRTNVFDLLDLPEVINYLAGARWCSENDDVWANMTFYRDTYGDGLWRIIPFDMNASWGQLYGGCSPLSATNDMSKSHPLYGGSQVQENGSANWNRLYDVIIALPETREMLLRRQRTLVDRFILPPGTPAPSLLIETHVQQMTNLIYADALLDRAKWGYSSWAPNKTLADGTADLVNQFVGPHRSHWAITHCITNTAKPIGLTNTANAGIPLAQPSNAVITVASLDFNPASSNQAQEYICLTNPTSTALDISGWKLDGAINFTFKPGTIMPSNSLLYVSPDVNAFRARTTGPRGGLGLFIVGPYSGQLSARGETILVKDDAGRLASSNSYAGNPSLAQQFLRVTEVMYNPPSQAGPYDAQEFEFVELKNISTNLALALAGVHFTNGIDFTFTGSAVTSLGPQQTVLIVKNASAFAFRYGAGFTNIAGQFTGSLDNGGERLQLLDASNEEIHDFTYNNSWYPLTDGLGFSLVVVDELAQPDAWDSKYNWRASGTVNGNPGAGDPGSPTLAPILVNELLPRPGLAALDAVELFNPTSNDVGVGGWFLTDDFFTPKKYRIPDGTTNLAGGYLVFTEADFNPGGLGFSFSSQGEEVYLFSGDAAGNLTGYYHGYSFGAAETNVTFGRYVNSTGDEDFTAQLAPTLGTNNAGPLVGPVVLNEIMYNPAALTTNDPPAAYLELLNITATNVPLYSVAQPTNTWHLRNAVDFDFPTNVTLLPGRTLVVVGFDPATNATALAAFRSRYGVATNAPIYGPWQGGLPNDEGVIELKKPDLATTNSVPYIMVERVHYHDSAPWPAQADGSGATLFRRHATEYANEPTNWIAALPSPGTNPPASQAPVITVQPQSRLAILGTNITFSLTATGAAPLAFQWTLRGTNLPGATNASLALTNLQLIQTGPYQALAMNPAGAVWSDIAYLALPLAITSPPSNQSAFAHDAATFTVGVSGDGPLFHQWRFNGTNLPGATNSTLFLSDVLPANAGSYSVFITNVVSAVTSAPALLTVWTNPVITSQPQSRAAAVGSNVTFTVAAASGTPLLYQWYFSTSNALAGATNDSYSIPNIQTTNYGFYSVLVSDSYGSVWSDSAQLADKVKPTVTQQPQPTNSAVLVGGTASLTITAVGPLPLSFQWRRIGTPLTNAILWTTNSAITLTNAQLTNAGYYDVVVTNLSGSAPNSSRAYLTVMEPLVGQAVRPGSNVTFSFNICSYHPVSTSANYIPRYQWWFNQTNLVLTVTNLTTSLTNVTLSLTNVQLTNEGTYQVTLTNSSGLSTTQAAALVILRPPTLTRQPTNQIVLAGGTASFTVAIDGSGPLQYRWQRNGGDLPEASGPTLVLTNAQVTNAGNYRVVITNSEGSVTSDVAVLTVLVPPSITLHPADQTVRPGTNVTFTVTADGTAPLAYQWRFGPNPIPGSTNFSLTLSNVSAASAGSYSVLVTNVAGTATGGPAVLTVLDIQPPVILACAPPQTLAVGTNCRVTLPDFTTSVTATDDFGAVTITQAPPTGTQLPVGLTNILLTVTDGSGNFSTCSTAVTVRDQTAPAILFCFTNLTLATLSNCQARMPDLTTTNYILATDNCSSVTVTQSVATNTLLALGTNPVVLAAFDTAGNVVYRTNAIIVTDQTPPLLICPAPLFVSADTGQFSRSNVTFAPTASDNCALASVSCVPPSGATFPVGTTPVNCTATDASGLTTICEFDITVNVAGMLTAATNDIVNLRIPDGSPVGLVSSVNLASPIERVTDVNVTLNISGGFNGDLHAYLVHDSGHAILLNRPGKTLANPSGYSDAGFNLTLDDEAINGDIHSYRQTLFGNPNTPLSGPLTNAWAPDGREADPALVLDATPRTATLSAFRGLNPNGRWTLFIADADAVYASTLVSWGLVIHGTNASPVITAQPQSRTNISGTTAAFSVTAAALSTPAYQWRFGSTALPGATNATLSLPNVQATNAGGYTVIVTSLGGSVTSQVATLTVQQLQINGLVALEAYVGAAQNGRGTRTVTFQATGDATNLLASWNLPLDFAPGADGYGVASFTLTNVPAGTTHLSAKTAWNLRQRLLVTFLEGQATANFTGPRVLPGGDVNNSNVVDIDDYFQLAAAWYRVSAATDIDGSGLVDIFDYFLLASHWYQVGDPD